jgi:hypothetical protein
MTHTAFETPNLDLKGKINATVHEHGGVAPTRIIRTDNSWALNIDWEITGSAVPLICGTWHVHVRMESMGPGGELSLFDPDCNLPLDPGGDGKYRCHFDVPAGKVQAAHEGTPYRIVVVLTYRNPVKRPGPLHAVYDAGIFSFFNPGPPSP